MDVHKAIQEHIICLLKRYLEDLPDLSPVVVDAANHLLKEYQAPLCAAVTDLTHAYTYVVEPLHVQVRSCSWSNVPSHLQLSEQDLCSSIWK